MNFKINDACKFIIISSMNMQIKNHKHITTQIGYNIMKNIKHNNLAFDNTTKYTFLSRKVMHQLAIK